jgi:hypothetical protein
MYGRLMGKRVEGEFWLSDSAKSGTHACDYLLACDMEMDPIQGFEFANWERGHTSHFQSMLLCCAIDVMSGLQIKQVLVISIWCQI